MTARFTNSEKKPRKSSPSHSVVINRRDPTRERPVQVQQRKPAPRLAGGGGSGLGPHAQANAGGRTATSPRCLQKSRGLRRVYCRSSSHGPARWAENTESQKGYLSSARRLEEGARVAATGPVRKCLSSAHVALPGSRVTKRGHESRELPCQSPGGCGRLAERRAREVLHVTHAAD